MNLPPTVRNEKPLSRRDRLIVQYALVELSRAGQFNHWDLADGPPPTEDEAVDLVSRVLDLADGRVN